MLKQLHLTSCLIIREVVVIGYLVHLNAIARCTDEVLNKTNKNEHLGISQLDMNKKEEKNVELVKNILIQFWKSTLDEESTRINGKKWCRVRRDVLNSLTKIRHHLIRAASEKLILEQEGNGVLAFNFEAFRPYFVNHKKMFEMMKSELQLMLKSNLVKCKSLSKDYLKKWLKSTLLHNSTGKSYALP